MKKAPEQPAARRYTHPARRGFASDAPAVPRVHFHRRTARFPSPGSEARRRSRACINIYDDQPESSPRPASPVEELFARGRLRVGVLVDVQNTLVNNASCAGAATTRSRSTFPKLAAEWVGAYALSEAGSGSDAFALATRATTRRRPLGAHRPQAVDHQRRRGEIFIVFAERQSRGGLQGDHRVPRRADFPGFTVGKKEDKLGIRASSTCELILEDVPRAARTCSARWARATRSPSRR
jgi:alkylation response protein AidB-like acyl-CoA dehydrogenase